MGLESCLKNGFWSQSRVSTFVINQYEDDGVLCEEFTQVASYIGQQRQRLVESFCVAWDIYVRYFILLQFADNDPKPF